MKLSDAWTLLLLPLIVVPLPLPLQAATRPKLVVVAVIDQFRADYLTRFRSRFLPARGTGGRVGGFEYLMSRGAYYPQAQYDLSQCVTGAGHSVISTGAYPYQTGIVSNEWYSRRLGRMEYCVEDGAAKLVGSPGKGMSPRNLIGSTIGDELKNAGYPSRVVAVAIKDRAAILLGGHRADLALWFDTPSMKWVTSNYYLKDADLPEWVRELNSAAPTGIWKWQANEPGTGLTLPRAFWYEHDTHWEPKLLGLTFPHAIPQDSRWILNAPIGLELTEKAAEAAIDHYHLGGGDSTDLLLVSFSSHDYAGHAFGPNSREMEEMTIADDQAIAGLLRKLEASVPGGLAQVTFVLTADHGVAGNPEYLASTGLDAGRLRQAEFRKAIDARLLVALGDPGKGRSWIAEDIDINFWLDHTLLEERKVPLIKARAALKEALLTVPAVAWAMSADDYSEHKLPPGILGRQILHTYRPDRGADALAILKPYYFTGDDTADHMSGYAYDRTVPLILSGFGIRSGVHPERAEINDIAPTLSFLLGVVPPALSEGRVLSEVLKR